MLSLVLTVGRSEIPDIAVFTHRWSEYLPRLIDSIARYTWSSYNLIVVCEPGNCQQNMNKVLERSSSRYVCLLDEDILILHPYWIDMLIGLLRLREDLAVVGAAEVYDPEEAKEIVRSAAEGKPKKYEPHYVVGSYVPAYTMLIDRCRVPNVTFDENIPGIKGMGDTDFCFRVRPYKCAVNNCVRVFHEFKLHWSDERFVDHYGLDLTRERQMEDFVLQIQYMERKYGIRWGVPSRLGKWLEKRGRVFEHAV